MHFSFFIALSLFILLSAFFSASETALFSLPVTKLNTYAHSTDPKKKKIYRLLKQPNELLVTILMFNILVNILVQNISSSVFAYKSSWTYKVGLPLFLTLFFGEIIPKSLALPNNQKIALFVIDVINKAAKCTAPLRKAITYLTNQLSRIIFFFLKKEQDISKEELQHVLETSEKYGIILPQEAKLISGYLNLQDAHIKELMHPREDMIYHDLKDPLSKLTYLFMEKECTRIPIVENGIDNVLGVLYAGEFFLQRKQIKTAQDLKKVLKKAFFVPETTTARKLFQQMERQQQTLGIVVDEYGAISGLITQEDLLETVIGKISDLRDKKNLYTKNAEDTIIASGKLELTEFQTIFDCKLTSPSNMMTIGGWLCEKLGTIPKTASKYTLEGFFFHILAADPNRVKRIYIRKIPIDSQINKLSTSQE